MQKIAISYADRGFVAAQRENARTALSVGGFDTALCYRRHHLGMWFRWRRRRILRQPRGAGYWVWKPYLIRHTLRQMRDGDILFYSDCDARFVSSIDPLLPILSGLADPGIIVFSLEDFRINRIWTKRDCFHYLGLDTPSYIDGLQVTAGLFICRRSRPALAFVEEWLAAVLDARIVTDAPNVCGLPNYPGFRDHRHDQSVLSLLARKHGLTTLPDVSQWGDDRRPPNLPRIIELTDRRD